MKLPLIKIGNSQGIRIPSSLIKQCRFEEMLNVEVKGRSLFLTAADTTRRGWEELSVLENETAPWQEEGDWEW